MREHNFFGPVFESIRERARIDLAAAFNRRISRLHLGEVNGPREKVHLPGGTS